MSSDLRSVTFARDSRASVAFRFRWQDLASKLWSIDFSRCQGTAVDVQCDAGKSPLMSEECGKNDHVEDYLQFTPLISTTPAKSIIASFQTPRVRPFRPTLAEPDHADQLLTGYQDISAGILTHAAQSRGYM